MENLENEIWKDIVGYEGLFKVSSIGRVKGINRLVYVTKENGNHHYRLVKERIKTMSIGNSGYLYVKINNIEKRLFISHRLVAQAFIPNPENLPCINHKNGIKTDNRVENLEWISYKNNSRHAIDTGLFIHNLKGENCSYATITDKIVLEIRGFHGKMKQIDIAKKFNLNKKHVNMIVLRKIWKHI